MPFIHLVVARPLAPEVKRELGRRATTLVVDILGKRREVTAALVETAEAGAWSIGGEAVAGSAAHCAVFITAGSNSADEKATLIAAMHELLRATLADLAEASYAVIHEIAAGDWGYGGRTQAARLVAQAAR